MPQSADNPDADFGDETEARGPLMLAEKLNGDLWWRFLNGPLSLFNGMVNLSVSRSSMLRPSMM
jgi:hypothetical protein